MKSLNNEEYLKLLESLVDQQYGDEELPDLSAGNAWIPAEPEIKKKIQNPVNQGFIDLTKVRKDKLKDQIKIHGFFIIGPFKVGVSERTIIESPGGHSETLGIIIYEEKLERHLNTSGVFTNKVDVLKDNRFIGRPWLKYFTSLKAARDVPLDTVVDIIKWLQGIHKLTAFL